MSLASLLPLALSFLSTEAAALPAAPVPEAAEGAKPDLTVPVPAWPDPRGQYRMDLNLTTIAQVPVIGKTVIQTNSIYTVTIEGTHEAPVQVQRICALNPNASRSIAKTKIPKSFIDNIAPKRFPLEIAPSGDGFSVRGDMKPLAIGFDRSKMGDSYPKKKDHPSVTDHENDGHPGATVHLQAPLFGQVEIYMVQHARTVISGTWDGGPVFTGSATVNDFYQRTIGASNRLFIANPKITAVPESSQFTLTRVPDGTTCAQLIAGAGT